MSLWLFTEEHKNLYDAKDVFSFMKPLLVREKKITKRGDFIWVLALNESLVLLSLELMKYRSFETHKGRFKTADFLSIPLTVKASCIMIVHSHDNGEIKPSDQDIMVTEKLINGGKTVDLVVLDHIIINTKLYNSMSENHPEMFGLGDF